MTQLYESALTEPGGEQVPPDARAFHFAQVVTHMVATGEPYAGTDPLPLNPDYTVVVDDPTGHFPLEVISPLDLRFTVGGAGVQRVFARSNMPGNDPRLELVRILRFGQGTLHGSLHPADQERSAAYGREARAMAREIPKPRELTFRSTELADNLAILRPVDLPAYQGLVRVLAAHTSLNAHTPQSAGHDNGSSGTIKLY